MSTPAKYAAFAAVIALPMVLLAVLPWLFGASGLSSVVSSFSLVMAAFVTVALGWSAGRTQKNPTPGGFAREAGLALVALVLVVVAIGAPSAL